MKRNPLRAEFRQDRDGKIHNSTGPIIYTKKRLKESLAKEISNARDVGIQTINVAVVSYFNPYTKKFDTAWSLGITNPVVHGNGFAHYRLEHEELEQMVEGKVAQKIFESTGRRPTSPVGQFARAWATIYLPRNEWTVAGSMAFFIPSAFRMYSRYDKRFRSDVIERPWDKPGVEKLLGVALKGLLDIGVSPATELTWFGSDDVPLGTIADWTGSSRKNPTAKAWPLYHYIPFAERYILRHRLYSLDEAYWQLRSPETPENWREAAELAWQEKPWSYVDAGKPGSMLKKYLDQAERNVRDTLVILYVARTMQVYDTLKVGKGYRRRAPRRRKGYIGGARRRNPQPYENYLALAESWIRTHQSVRDIPSAIAMFRKENEVLGMAAAHAAQEQAWENYEYTPARRTGSGLDRPGGSRRGKPGAPPVRELEHSVPLVNFIARTYEIYDTWAEGGRVNPATAVEHGAKTARKKGAVGKSTAVGNYVLKTAKKREKVLDFGAGPKARETKRLRKKGLEVTAWDLEPNFDRQLHDAYALRRKWQTVMAANVVNVIELPSMVAEVLDELARVTRKRGRLVINLPAKPRHNGLDADALERELKVRFDQVKRVAGSKKAPVFEARRPTGASPSAKPWHPRRNPGEDFNAIVKELGPSVMDGVRSSKTSPRSWDDAYQNALIRLWQRPPTGKSVGERSRYAYLVGRSSGVDTVRSEKTIERRKDLIRERRPDINQQELTDEEREELVRRLRALPRRIKNAVDAGYLLERVYLDQVPPKELAKELGVTQASMKNLLFRARAHAREWLKDPRTNPLPGQPPRLPRGPEWQPQWNPGGGILWVHRDSPWMVTSSDDPADPYPWHAVHYEYGDELYSDPHLGTNFRTEQEAKAAVHEAVQMKSNTFYDRRRQNPQLNWEWSTPADDEWVVHRAPHGGTCGATHLHRSGWSVQHCGHPTAIRPYYVLDDKGATHYSPNGGAWRLLADAKAFVLEHASRKNPEVNVREALTMAYSEVTGDEAGAARQIVAGRGGELARILYEDGPLPNRWDYPAYAERWKTIEARASELYGAGIYIEDKNAAVGVAFVVEPLGENAPFAMLEHDLSGAARPAPPWPWDHHFDEAYQLQSDSNKGHPAVQTGTRPYTPEEWEYIWSDDRSHGNDDIAEATSIVWDERDWTKHPWKEMPELFIARVFYEHDRIQLERMTEDLEEEQRDNPSKKHQERAAAIAAELRKTQSTTLSQEASNAVLAQAIRATWSFRDWSAAPVEDFIAQLLEYLDYIEMLALRDAWSNVQLPREITLDKLVTMKNATRAGGAKGMDFYLWRISGTEAYIGRPQQKWHENTIGMKVKKEWRSKLPPRTLFLYLAYLWRVGVMKFVAHGTVQQSIRQSDLKKIRVYGDLDEMTQTLAGFYR